MREFLVLPGDLAEKIKPERIPTPLADELEQRLTPYVERLEAMTPSGHHPRVAALAHSIVVIRQAEAGLLGIDPGTSPERIQKAKEIVAFARQMLGKMDASAIVARLGTYVGRA